MRETGKEERRMLWYNGKSMTLDVRNSIFYSLILTCCIIYKISQSAACCLLSRFSHVLLFATPGTIARQALLSRGFSRQEYWSGLPCPSPGDLPDPGIKPASLMSPTLAGRFLTTTATWEAHISVYLTSIPHYKNK